MTPLPKIGTPEWNSEVEFYLSAPRGARDNRARELGYTNSASYHNLMSRRGIHLIVPLSRREKFTKVITIKESCLIIFDAQIPFHDAGFLNNLLALAGAWGIQQGISGGDLLNMTAFSGFFEKPEDKVWAKERDLAVEVLLALYSAIPNWLLVKGNHENFLLRQLAHQIGHEDILALLDKREGILGGFTATDYYYCMVLIGKSKWRVTHPRNISVLHGRVPQRLCEKFECNVVSGHGHLAGMIPSYSGKYDAVDAGITCDPDRLDYVALRDSTRPAMCQGALFLIESEGQCFPYHIYPNADWKNLKRLYGK